MRHRTARRAHNVYSLAGQRGIRRRRKKTKLNLKKWTGLFAIFLCAGGVIYFLYGEIKQVKVQGADSLEEDNIIREAELQEGIVRREIFKGSYLERLAAHPEIKSARVVSLPVFELAIDVQKREPCMILLKDGDYWTVDRQGVVTGKSAPEKVEESNLIITGLEGVEEVEAGKRLQETEYGEKLLIIAGIVEKRSEVPVEEINLYNPENIKAYTHDGMEIWLGDGRNLSNKIELVKEGLRYLPEREERSVVDVRYGDRIIISPQ